MPLDAVAYRPYADPADFIREVTDRIWVDGDIDHIVDNYEPDSVVHVGLGTVVGRDGVIEGSTLRIADAPHSVAQTEDVIWEARGDDAFLSSHLVLASDDHVVDGRVRRVRARTVAQCLYRRGRMVEEWVARDTLAQALQTGIDPNDLARRQLFRGYHGSFTQPAPADVLSAGDSGPRPDDHRSECELVLDLFDQVWNRRNFARLGELAVRDLFLHSVGDTTYLRRLGYQRETLRLIAAFPSARFEIRDLQTNHDERCAGLRVGVTWKMTGRYDGRAYYGPLTNETVELLGVSQFLIQRGRIVREVRLYDDIALRSQINATRGDEAYQTEHIY